MICRKCGKEISDDARFCKYCGASVQDNSCGTDYLEKSETENKKKRGNEETDGKHRPIIRILLTILILTVCIGVGIFLSGRNGNEEETVVKNTVTGDSETDADILILESEAETGFSTEYETGTSISAEVSAETEIEKTGSDTSFEYSNGDIVYSSDAATLSYDENSYTVYYDNLLIVYTLTDMSEADAESLAAQVGGTIVGDISGIVNALQIKVASTDLESLNTYANILMESDQVLYASYEIPMAASDNTIEDQNPWSGGSAIADKNEDTPSGNDWWAEAIDAYSAWEYVDNNNDALSSVIVGILDSGFDTDHEDLGNISVINENSEVNHGTHVAGIIAAQNNTIGIRGIADGASLLCADWSLPTINDNGEAETISLLNTGEWIELTKQLLESGARVINNSWGLDQDLFDKILNDFYDALSLENKSRYESMLGSRTEIWQKCAIDTGNECLWLMVCLINSVNNGEISDFLMVQSAGNGYDNSGPGYDAGINGYYCSLVEDNYPAYSFYWENMGITYNVIKEHIMIVGAVKNEKNNEGYYLLSSYSNYGDAVDICAPGGEYNASADGSIEIFSLFADNSYGCLYGTSMAAPMVSGAAALIWSINPNLTAAEVKNIMLENCSVAMGVTDNDVGVIYPMLNVGLAVRAVSNLMQTEAETEEALVENSLCLTEKLDELVSTYGLFDASQSGTMNSPSDEWLNPAGIMSANIEDFDSDGALEMLVCISELCDHYNDGSYHIMMYMWEVENGKAVLADDFLYGSYIISDFTDRNIQEVTYTSTEWIEEITAVSTVLVEEEYYIVCEDNELARYYADGSMRNYWLLKYTDNQIQYVSSFTQNGEGSDCFEFTGYKFLEGECVSSDIYYTEWYENSGLYDKFGTAVNTFFEEYGILINDTISGYEYAWDSSGDFVSILSNDNQTISMFEFINESTSATLAANNYFTVDFTVTLTRGSELLDDYLNNDSESLTANDDDAENNYTNDIENQENVIDESEDSTLGTAYMKILNSDQISRYALYDVDQDGTQELLVETSSQYQLYYFDGSQAVLCESDDGALMLAYSQDVFGCTTGGLIVWDAGSSWINHYLLKLEDEKLIVADSLSENYRGDDPSAEDTNDSFDYESEQITFYSIEDLSLLNSLLYGENSSDSTSNDGSDLVIYENVPEEENDSEAEIVIVIQ